MPSRPIMRLVGFALACAWSVGACSSDRNFSQPEASPDDDMGGLGGALSQSDGGEGGQIECTPSLEDRNNCGSCGNICPKPTRADEVAACVDGICTATCVEGTRRCDDEHPVVLACEGGDFEYAETCEFICVDGECEGTCMPGDQACAGSSPATCDDGEWKRESACEFTCFEGECSGVCHPEEVRCGSEGRELCDSVGEWGPSPCPEGSTCEGEGTCRKLDGQPCESAEECSSDSCTVFYRDEDDDGYGDSDLAQAFCGTAPPEGYRTNKTDCCDSEPKAHPGQTTYYAAARKGCGGYDYDCSGKSEHQYSTNSIGCGSTVDSAQICSGWEGSSLPSCGSQANRATTCTCTVISQGCGQLCPAYVKESVFCR